MGTRTIDAGRLAVALTALVLTALLLITAGCGFVAQESQDSAGVAVAPMPADQRKESAGAPSLVGGDGSVSSEPYSPTGDVAANVADKDRLIIRMKTLRLEVKDVPDAVSSIRTLVEKRKGVITALQVASENDGPIYRYDEVSQMSGAALAGYVTVRVPATDFDAFVADVVKLGTVRSQSETSDDVTQQHVDLSARLENLRAEEKRLREFFDAAKDVKDMLAIESELSRVRGEIESMDAQVSYLERQAAMATVTIELTEPSAIVRPDGEDWGFRDAVTAGIRGAAQVLKVLIVVLITVAPYAAVGLLAFFGIRALVRGRRRRIRTPQPPAPPSDATTPEA
jgi:hypothetical protein